MQWSGLDWRMCGCILAAIGWLLVGGCAGDEATQVSGTTPKSAAEGLLPDVGGRPRLAVVSVNSARRAALRNADLVSNVVNGLPASVRFVVLTNDLEAFSVAGNDHSQRVRFVELPTESPLTIWTQDPFLVLRSPEVHGETTLLESRAFERADDRLMAAAVAEELGYRLATSELYFEGGNIVSDREIAFVGANTVRDNVARLGVGEREIVLRFERELGRRVLVVGPYPQPVAHIDMVVTPLGNGRVAVADAAAGAEIARRQLADDPRAVSDFESSCEVQFFGHPSITHIAVADGVASPPRVLGGTARMADRSLEVAPLLNDIATSLEQHGFRVERIPFLFGGPESRDRAASPQNESANSTKAAYPMLTYNNVLIEESSEGAAVYLPRYGWSAMDDAAARAWAEIGFTPHFIDGLTISAMYGGALRCSVKVLER